MLFRQLEELLLVIVMASEFQRPLQPDGLLRVNAHRLLECKQGNFGLRLIIDSQALDTVHLDTCFVRLKRGGCPLTNPVLHQSKEVPVDLEKLLDKQQIAYGSESSSKARAD